MANLLFHKKPYIRFIFILASLVLVVGLVFSVLTFFRAKGVEAAWYSDTWGFRTKLTIDHTKVGGANEVFDIGHETGDLSQYSSTSGTVAATTASALGGTSYGLGVTITSQTAAYAAKSSIPATANFRYRFYIDPNGLTMANGDSFTTLYIKSAGGSWPAITVVSLKYVTGTGYQLIGEGYNDASSNVLNSTANITDAPHYVEVNAVRATNATSSDGSYQWWIDGVSQGSATGVDNYNRMSDYSFYGEIGARDGIDAGTSGTFYVDEWAANNDGSTIGPVLTDFPVYVDLSLLPSSFHSHVNQTDARDIRVTKGDGVTELPREVVYYTSGTRTGELHFKYTGTLSSSTDTSIYIYYGNANASDYAANDTYGKNNVWDSSYSGVHHVQNNSFSDSTSGAHNGTNNNSTSATGHAGDGRLMDADGEYFSVPLSGYVHASVNTIEWWYKNTTTPLSYSSFFNSSEGGDQLTFNRNASDTTLSLALNSSNYIDWGSLATNVFDGGWHHIVVALDTVANTEDLYIDGTNRGQKTQNPANIDISTYNLLWGSNTSSAPVNGIIDETRVSSNILRSSTWISTEYNNQNSPSTFFTEGGEERRRGSILNFAFDEGYLTTAHDSSPNGYIGTLSGTTTPSWQPEDLCISGKCLYYEGSTAYTSVTTSVPNVQSVSFWVKPKTNGETLVDFDGGTHYLTASSGTITATGFSSPTVYVNGQSGGLLIANAWQHVEVTTATAFTASNITIGKKTAFLNGYIDEFKVYDYVRTAAQVKLDFNSRNSQSGVAARFGPDGSWFSNGLVGYWKMDENTGTAVTDYSGNGNTGTLTNTPAWSSGKYGPGVYLDPATTNKYIGVPSSASLDNLSQFTMSVWVNPSQLQDDKTIIKKSGIYGLYFGNISSGLRTQFYMNCTGGEVSVFSTSTDNLTLNVWSHLVVTWNGSACTKESVNVYINGKLIDKHLNSTSASGTKSDDSGSPFAIGNAYASYATQLQGSIDEVRVYNRALSPAEIGQLYSWAPGPVGYWKMDENTGTSAYDSSGYGNTGTLTNSPSWGAGKFGSGVVFDGSNDYINTNVSTSYTVYTFSTWVFARSLGTSTLGRIFDKRQAGSEVLNLMLDSTYYTFDQWFSGAQGQWATPPNSLILNRWNHVAVTYDTSSATNDPIIYVNGVQQVLTEASTPLGTVSTNSDNYIIGNRGNADRTFDGYIDDFRIYNYARTSSQVIEDMNGGHPVPGSPVGSSVAYWKFDEGYLTTAYDNSINANNLTLSTASWTNSGKFGKAFNGLTNVRASRTTDADLEFGATEDFTLSLWYKSDSATNPSAVEYLINDGAAAGSAGYAIYANTSGNLCFGIDDDVTWGPDVASCTTTDVYDNTWHHITAVRNVTSDTTKIYLDAVEKDSDTDTTTATLDSSPTFYIGDANATDGTDEFLGDIDEVKIFRSALTADAIKVLYNQNAAQSLGALSTDSSNNPSNSSTDSYCPPGQGSACVPPVGEWKFDENTGTTSTFDTSTNENTGTLEGSMTAADWVPGKHGSALDFDGTNDKVNAGTATALDNMGPLTWEAWIYPRTGGDSGWGRIFSKLDGSNLGTEFFMDTTNVIDSLKFSVAYSGTGLSVIASSNSITLNVWQHVAVTWDDSATATNVHIYVNGKEVSSYDTRTNGTLNQPDDSGGNMNIGDRADNARSFNGLIDDAKVYNYVRTPAQIAWDYNYGKPVGWWKMDENTGTTANDSMGNSTAGTLTNTPTWATGKLNSAVSFAGSNQHVLIGDDPDFDFADDKDMTLTTWFKHTTASAQEVIMSKYAAAGYKIIMESDGDITCGLDYDSTWTPTDSATSTAATYDDGNWHHIACVKTGATSLALYIDGILITTDSSITATNTLTNADPVYFGIDADGTSNDFTGSLDDTRIYRYPLTAQQIKTVMGEGAVRFGPASGSP